MTRYALALAPALLLGACSYLGAPQTGGIGPQGHYNYEAAPGPVFLPGAHGHAGHTGHAYRGGFAGPQPVAAQNPCALGGPCPQGGYATVGAGHRPDAHAYGGALHGGPGYGLRGYSDPYKGRGFAYATLGAQLFDVERDNVGIQARVGYQSHNIAGVELEGTLGVTEESDSIAFVEPVPDGAGGELGRLGTTIDTNAKIDTQFAGFATARFPVGERFALRGRGGYHFTEVSADVRTRLAFAPADGSDPVFEDATVHEMDTFDGFAWGAGAEVYVSPRSAIRADYTRYHNGSGGQALDSVALAYSHRF